MSLVGKLIFLDHGEHYHTGEVVEKISPELYLIQMDPVGKDDPSYSMLFDALELVQSVAFFFDSRKALQSFLAQGDEPSKTPKIVHLKDIRDEKKK